MIRVEPAPAPDDFEELVAVPGRRLLLELTGDSKAPKRRGRKRKSKGAYARVEDIPVTALNRDHYWTNALP